MRQAMASRKRASALDLASALAGGAFFSVTIFFVLGAAVWAGLSLIKAPLPALTAGEAVAALAALGIGVAIVRNALHLAVTEPL